MTDDLTPRVAALRARLRQPEDAPAYAGEEPFHAAWLAHDDAPFPLRLAHAQAAWRAAVRPVITPDAFIIGTPPSPAIISYPTGVFAWDFRLDPALAPGHPDGEAIVAYWQAWLAQRPAPNLPDLAGLAHTLWCSGLSCHSTQDYGLALEVGIDGLHARVDAHASAHPEAADWYAALHVTLDGVSAYIAAHAIGEYAADCRHIAHHPPATFHQAAQLFEFLFLLNGHDSPGRLDQFLWPALARELAVGSLTLDAAQEIVDGLYLQLAERYCYGATLGGQLPEGGDATNPLTWLCLNSIRRLRLLSPRTALRWHRGTPDDLFAATVHSIAGGATYPTLVNDETVLPGMTRRGATPEHARDYTFCGCGQVIPHGRAYGAYEDVILNGAKPLTLALHDGRDECTGAQLGPRTGTDYPTFAALEEAVWTQCTALLTRGIAATNAVRAWGAARVPDYLRSLLTHSCVERGLDWRAGGADYHDGMVDVVGLTTLCDALLVLDRVVYQEKRLTLSAFTALLDADWAGDEALRNYCLREVPKFGNEDPAADGLLRRWLTRLNEWLFAQRTTFGGRWGLDIIGWSGAVYLGAGTGATPDGRRAGEALADCAGPAQGRDKNGVTAVLNSMLTLPAADTHGPLALNLRVPADAVRTEDGEARLAALLRSYLERGGMHLQVTVADAAVLHAAQADPDAHRDLLVRVGGFSAYFVELEARFQQDMLRRTEHAVG